MIAIIYTPTRTQIRKRSWAIREQWSPEERRERQRLADRRTRQLFDLIFRHDSPTFAKAS
jgi:hypothetical protein